MFKKKSKYSPYLSDFSPSEETETAPPSEAAEKEPEQSPVPAAPDPAAAVQAERIVLETGGDAMEDSDLTASVSKNSVFTGDIITKDNIDIFGQVQGSVTSSAIAKIYGEVQGDVNCRTLVANHARIAGNIVGLQSAVIGSETVVEGNVSAATINISGRINGNVIASESVSITDSGAVYGDISTPVMELCKGAIVFGAVVMEKEGQTQEVNRETPEISRRESLADAEPINLESEAQPVYAQQS